MLKENLEALSLLGLISSDMEWHYRFFIKNWNEGKIMSRKKVLEDFGEKHGEQAEHVAEILLRLQMLGNSSDRHEYLAGLKAGLKFLNFVN